MKTQLFNPFEKYSDRTLVALGLLSTIMGIALGFVFNARFDGAMDLHFVEKVSAYQTALDIGINILCTSILLFIAGKIINTRTRMIDAFLISMIAKIPLYLVTFFNVNNKIYATSEAILELAKQEKPSSFSVDDMFFFLLFAIITILALIWSITLFFNGFKVATNAKETKHILIFIGALIFAEILSKILIITLNQSWS